MLNVLNSHAYTDRFWEDVILAKCEQVRFIMDSGAFSAFFSGVRFSGSLTDEYLNPDRTLSVDGYCRRLERLKEGLWQYIALDVVGDIDTSLENLDTLVERGFRPMPVVTTDASLDLVPGFTEINSHICVAGGVTGKLEQYSARLEAIYRRAGKDSKLHGLAYTRLATVRSRVWSVDSSSWLGAARFGSVAVFDRARGGLTMKSYKKRSREVVDLLLRSGVHSQLDVMPLKSGTFSVINALSVYSWLEYARFLRSRGVRFFFAISSIRDLCFLVAVATSIDSEGRLDLKMVKAAEHAPTAKKGVANVIIDLLNTKPILCLDHRAT